MKRRLAPPRISLLDIETMVHAGGKERTREEYAQLFEQAGFSLKRVVATAGPGST